MLNVPPGESGEKYIYITSNGTYLVKIVIHGGKTPDGYREQFRLGMYNTLEESIEARDKYLSK